MPYHFIVPLCTNNSVMCDLHFYRLPVKKAELLKKWLVAIRRDNTPVHHKSRVCSAHFEGGEKMELMMLLAFLHGLRKRKQDLLLRNAMQQAM